MRFFRNFAASLLMILAVFVSLNGISPAVANAATAANCKRESANFLGFPTWYKYLEPQFRNGACELTIKFPEDLAAIGFAVFEIILRIAGFAAVFFVVYGGFLYMTSQGEPERAANGRTTIVNALVGMMIAILATAIVNLVARNIA